MLRPRPAALAEFERELIRAHERAVRTPKARGVKREPKLSDHQRYEAIKLLDNDDETFAGNGRSFNA